MALASTLPVRPVAAPRPLQPLGPAGSLALFGVPALLLYAAVWGLQPALLRLGVDAYLSSAIPISLINIGLVVAALVAYRREGRPLTWAAFAERMRLGGLDGRAWKWTLGGFLVMGVLSLVTAAALVAVYRALNWWPPDTGGASDNLAVVMVVLALNIVGEEFWWRGYILPRQELHFGQRTWVIHGILWACFHVFKWWAVPGQLLTCLVIPFIAQRLKNTTPGMVIHFTLNAIGSISVIALVLVRLLGAGG